MVRVPSHLEPGWTPQPDPRIVADPEDPESSIWTWMVEDADATAVVLWTNPVFDHREVSRAEFIRLPDSDLWTISLRLPAALRASYRIGIWRQQDPPPWRTASGRREVILAAMATATIDPAGGETIRGSWGEPSSIAAGPRAPVEPWRGLPSRPVASRVDEVRLSGEERGWVYSPGPDANGTPLLVLFDGQVWLGLGLQRILDSLIGAGLLPPLHVALLDSGSHDQRWARLGVPGGQVDTVLDHLLPRLRADWPVDPRGETTWVSGQSLGGIAALWTIALAEGEVQHAIAQSPSLWRFEIADALLDQPGWASIALQAGSFEADMLADARTLHETLRADPRLAGRRVECAGFEAGHDWAAWRANLMAALVRGLAGDQAVG